ncbi:Cof-type HAD-IIB family hydrolase [Trichococcus collinsii]|uniref:Cof protein n=1 Tax=Trichococcus collinsii TaxID=157076 RepID=A0AB38A3Q0_9LACT|nr:Cof-type HAD-IIB family hydrolase [Trichococcus collinsii]CZQ99303.1 cof protein [Trichococcus collinsii]SEA93081.1 hypothetical protein SAMN04488525_11122 [Trichococcus collinsii]
MSIFAIDLDGTLLTDDHQVTKMNKQAIQLAESLGNTIVIATGRSVHSAVEHLKMLEIDGYVVALNGAVVMETSNQEILFEKMLHKEGAKAMLEIGEAYNANVSISCLENNYQVDFTGQKQDFVQEFLPGQTPFTIISHQEAQQIIQRDSVLKVAIMNENIEKLEEMKRHLFESGHPVISSDTHYIELMAEGVNKGYGTRIIAEKLEVPKNDIVVFGDQENDLGLFAIAGVSFAMGNANPAIRLIADHVIESNNESGVGKTIMRLLDNRRTVLRGGQE